MRPWHVGLGLVLILTVTFVSCHSFTTMTYFCSECAAERRDVDVIPFGLGPLFTIRGQVTPTEYTALMTAVDRGACSHLWVFGVGSGGSYV